MDTLNQHLNELKELIQSRQPYIFENYPKIRAICSQSYDGLPEIDPLRQEIIFCILFGLYQASITLTNHLLEKYLKLALIYHNMKTTAPANNTVEQVIKSTQESRKNYNSEPLAKNIKYAFEQGIITEDDKNKLHEYRENFRNAYSHADAAKTFKDKSVPVMGGQFNDKEFFVEPQIDAQITELPMLQGFVQIEHAKASAIPYFLFLDELIRRTKENIFKHN